MHLEEYESILREREFTLRYVIDTHVHADHVSGARRPLAAHPKAELCLHESADVAYACGSRRSTRRGTCRGR